jgi:hypothetical protein
MPKSENRRFCDLRQGSIVNMAAMRQASYELVIYNRVDLHAMLILRLSPSYILMQRKVGPRWRQVSTITRDSFLAEAIAAPEVLQRSTRTGMVSRALLVR